MVVQGWHEAREQLWRQLRNGSARSRYERGDYLYTPDQPAHTLFLLTSGFVRLQIVSSEGRALTIRLVEPRQVFGHAALAGPGSYDSYAEALGAVEVYQVKRQELQLAIQRDPALSLVLIDELGQYCTTMSQRLDEVAFKSVPSRLASLLITMASDLHSSHHIKLPRRTHQQLADMINAQRETVTKTINEFRAAHLLEVDRTAFTLLNMDRLRELAAR